MKNSSDNKEDTAKQIASEEINNVQVNPAIIKQNECAACHILFKLVDKMQVSESDASEILSEILFHDPKLNDIFIEMVEDIHMKKRMTGMPFSIKSRDAKDRYIESNFKNLLTELSSDFINYGSDIVLRKLRKILVLITMLLLKNFITICERMIRKHMKVSLHLLMVSIKEIGKIKNHATLLNYSDILIISTGLLI